MKKTPLPLAALPLLLLGGCALLPAPTPSHTALSSAEACAQIDDHAADMNRTSNLMNGTSNPTKEALLLFIDEMDEDAVKIDAVGRQSSDEALITATDNYDTVWTEYVSVARAAIKGSDAAQQAIPEETVKLQIALEDIREACGY
jgi:hypothetical protein